MGPAPTPPGRASVRPARPRRPWYLSLALLFAWLMGVIAIVMSSMTLSLPNLPADEFALKVDNQSDLTPLERERQKTTFDAYTSALRSAAHRVVPLAVAELLLGAGMVIFAQRALGGRPWARQALIQLIVAHVGLSVVEWKVTPDLRKPEDDFQLALDNLDRGELAVGTSKLVRLGLSAGVSALTVLGLTRRRARAFYELAPASES